MHPTRPQFDKIMVYCQKVSYTADWGFLLTNIVRVNPAGALEFLRDFEPRPAEAAPAGGGPDLVPSLVRMLLTNTA